VGDLAGRVRHGVVQVARFSQPALNVVFIGVDKSMARTVSKHLATSTRLKNVSISTYSILVRENPSAELRLQERERTGIEKAKSPSDALTTSHAGESDLGANRRSGRLAIIVEGDMERGS
jgi:hypothetical protein